MTPALPPPASDEREPPPLLGAWRNLYALVLLVLVLVVLALWRFTVAFA